MVLMGMRRRGALVSLALFSSLTLFGAKSRADEADRAFQEALSLFDAGKIPAACAKFAESLALDPALGTLQNLAACHEREGKRAQALREWLDLADGAQRAGKTAQETLARQHVVELSTRLPRLHVRIDAKSGVERVELDDVAIDPSTTVTIDPGHHRLAFSGRDRTSSTRTFEATDGQLLELDAPILDPIATVAAPPVVAPPPPPHRPEQKPSTMGWYVGGAGLVALAVGSGFGIAAITTRGASDDHCPVVNGAEACTLRGVELNDRAGAYAWVANIGIGAGIVALGIATWMILTTPAAHAGR